MQPPSQQLTALFNYDLHTIAKQIFDAHARTFVSYLAEAVNTNDRCLSTSSPASSPSSSSSSTTNSETSRILAMVCIIKLIEVIEIK